MKTKIFTLLFLAVFSTVAYCQNSIDQVLTEIEGNSSTLAVMRQQKEASMLENKTGIFPENPELEFHYLWGSPSEMGIRKDISVVQSFDFPSVYSHRSHIAKMKNGQLETEYQRERVSVLTKARLLCIDLTYYNALEFELNSRLKLALKLANAYKLKFNVGECSILDYNKAQINAQNLQSDSALVQLEKKALLTELVILNGGREIEFSNSVFYEMSIDANFEQWYSSSEKNIPELNWLNTEIEISKRQEKLERSLSLPKLQTGYMSEAVTGEQFQGLAVGISIPLWENRNKVKHAKATSLTLEKISVDNKNSFYNKLKLLHSKTISLQNEIIKYSSVYDEYNNTELLNKALNNGQISLINYFQELSFYYDGADRLLEMKRDFLKSAAELNQYNQ